MSAEPLTTQPAAEPDERVRWREKMRRTARRLMPIVLGSGMFAALKAGLVLLIDSTTTIEPWLNYLIVLVGISVLGWVYHSKVSFKVPLTKQTFIRYVQQAVALKALDYGLYTLLVYGLVLNPALSVLLVSGLIFILRVIVYIKYVYVVSVADA